MAIATTYQDCLRLPLKKPALSDFLPVNHEMNRITAKYADITVIFRVFERFDIRYGDNVAINIELDVAAEERHSVDPLRVMGVLRYRFLGKRLHEH